MLENSHIKTKFTNLMTIRITEVNSFMFKLLSQILIWLIKKLEFRI